LINVCSMSGHNKWSGIKHRKEAQDNKRAKIFTRVAKLITIAAQQGGGDLDSNPSLKVVVDKARSVNMPNDNIQRAIKRGTGEGGDATKIEEVLYEAMGPEGSAMLILCATDNTNRALTDVKTALKKNDGKFVSGGGVLFQFAHVGQIAVETDDVDAVELAAIEAGAEDVSADEGVVIVTTAVSELHVVREQLIADGLAVADVRIAYVPQQTVELSASGAALYENLYDVLDEIDDVQEIYTNVA